MGRNKISVEKEHRQAQVAEMYCRGVRQVDIARELGVTQGQVSKDLAAVRKAWMASSIRAFDQHRAEQLARIDEIERQAWAGWLRSVGTQRQTTNKTRVKGGPAGAGAGDDQQPAAAPDDLLEETIVEHEDAGDSRFLDRMAWCVSERCKILGLYAPVRTEAKMTFSDLSDEELAAKAEQMGLLAPPWVNRIRGATDAERN